MAAPSSCHMLWFLSIAARRGFLVESYRDEAIGVMDRNADGQLAMTQVTLRPAVVFGEENRPDADEVAAMHHESHEQCFIARSVKTGVRCEPVPAAWTWSPRPRSRCRPEDFEAVLALLRQLWPDKVPDATALRAVYDRALLSDAQAHLCATSEPSTSPSVVTCQTLLPVARSRPPERNTPRNLARDVRRERTPLDSVQPLECTTNLEFNRTVPLGPRVITRTPHLVRHFALRC